MAKKAIDIKIPDFYTDPLFQSSQNTLNTFGQDLLGGRLPDFYSSLGKTDTPEFNNLLSLINRDTARAVNENLVRRNITRGGVGLSTIAKTMSDVGTKLRWEDFTRAQGEKQWLMGTGLNTVAGVGSNALNYGGQQNTYNLNKSQLEIAMAEANAKAKQAKNDMWQKIISSTIGTIGTIGGFMIGGPVGAGVGGSLGGFLGNSSPSGMPSENVLAAPANYYKSSAATKPLTGIPWFKA